MQFGLISNGAAEQRAACTLLADGQLVERGDRRR